MFFFLPYLKGNNTPLYLERKRNLPKLSELLEKPEHSHILNLKPLLGRWNIHLYSN